MVTSRNQGKGCLCWSLFCFGLSFYAYQLWCQPTQYWQGDYSAAHSWSPLSRWSMGIHPAAFLGQGVVELAILAGVILVMPLRVARVIYIWAMISYVLGIASWLRVHTNYWVLFSSVFVPAILISVSLQKASRSSQAPKESPDSLLNTDPPSPSSGRLAVAKPSGEDTLD